MATTMQRLSKSQRSLHATIFGQHDSRWEWKGYLWFGHSPHSGPFFLGRIQKVQSFRKA